MVNIKTESEKIKSFLLYFTLVMIFIMSIGIYFIYQEILNHAEDIVTHKEDTNRTKMLANDTNQLLREHIKADL